MSTPSDQILRLVEALAGAGVAVVNDFSASDRPVILELATPTGLVAVRVFCWNVTPGGAHRAADEYRVQTTRPGNVPLYLGHEIDLVLGYYEDLDVFVAWDAMRHPNPGGSSSLQVPFDQLEEAASAGFIARPRQVRDGEDELVVAFQPRAIVDYLTLLFDLRYLVDESPDDAAAAVNVEEEGDLPVSEDPERRRALSRVNRLVRDARFRTRVLRAYNGKCVFCGVGDPFVEAAHIRPVAAGGTDRTPNGLAACRNHHRALDLGLLLISDDLAVEINERRSIELGLDDNDATWLRDSVGEALHVPRDAVCRPAQKSLQWHRENWA